jgi:hypothetical protein
MLLFQPRGASVGAPPVPSQALGFAKLLVLVRVSVRLHLMESKVADMEKEETTFVAQAAEGRMGVKLDGRRLMREMGVGDLANASAIASCRNIAEFGVVLGALKAACKNGSRRISARACRRLASSGVD